MAATRRNVAAPLNAPATSATCSASAHSTRMAPTGEARDVTHRGARTVMLYEGATALRPATPGTRGLDPVHCAGQGLVGVPVAKVIHSFGRAAQHTAAAAAATSWPRSSTASVAGVAPTGGTTRTNRAARCRAPCAGEASDAPTRRCRARQRARQRVRPAPAAAGRLRRQEGSAHPRPTRRTCSESR